MLIGLTGPARSGKDTVAEHLEESHGFERYALAGPIKEMLHAGLGLSYTEMHSGVKEDPLLRLGIDKSPRQLMQTLGTEWGRKHVHPDIWLILAQLHWDQMRLFGRPMVISDVRFENEAHWIRMHGLLVHIVRPDAPRVSAHSSEAGVERLVSLDHTIHNVGSINDLLEDVDELVESYSRAAKQRESA